MWCPKYRRSVLTDDPNDGAVDTRLKEIIAQVCVERGAELIEFETMPDHVHLLVGVDPQYGVHRLVKQIKGRSSRLLRDESRAFVVGSPRCGRTRTSSPRSVELR